MQKTIVSSFTVTKPVDIAILEVGRALRAVHAIRSKTAHTHLDYTTREAGVIESKAALRHARVSFVSGLAGKTSENLASIKQFADTVFDYLSNWYAQERLDYISEATVSIKARHVNFTVPTLPVSMTHRTDKLSPGVSDISDAELVVIPTQEPASEKEDASDAALLQELSAMVPAMPLLEAVAFEPLSEHSDSIGDVGVVVEASPAPSTFPLSSGFAVTNVGWLKADNEAEGLSSSGTEEEGGAHVDSTDGAVIEAKPGSEG